MMSLRRSSRWLIRRLIGNGDGRAHRGARTTPAGLRKVKFRLSPAPSDAINCGMAKEDPVSKAFMRLSEGAGREAATHPTGIRLMDLVSFALWTLVLLALVGLGFFALFGGWLLPDD